MSQQASRLGGHILVDQLAARAIDQLSIASAPQAPIWQPHMVKTS